MPVHTVFVMLIHSDTKIKIIAPTNSVGVSIYLVFQHYCRYVVLYDNIIYI